MPVGMPMGLPTMPGGVGGGGFGGGGGFMSGLGSLLKNMNVGFRGRNFAASYNPQEQEREELLRRLMEILGGPQGLSGGGGLSPSQSSIVMLPGPGGPQPLSQAGQGGSAFDFDRPVNLSLGGSQFFR